MLMIRSLQKIRARWRSSPDRKPPETKNSDPRTDLSYLRIAPHAIMINAIPTKALIDALDPKADLVISDRDGYLMIKRVSESDPSWTATHTRHETMRGIACDRWTLVERMLESIALQERIQQST